MAITIVKLLVVPYSPYPPCGACGAVPSAGPVLIVSIRSVDRMAARIRLLSLFAPFQIHILLNELCDGIKRRKREEMNQGIRRLGDPKIRKINGK